MKKIVTLLTASMASVALNAQITLNQSDYANWKPGVDSYHQHTVNPALSTNANWDFSVGSYTMRYEVPYAAFSNTAIPNAAFTYEAYYGFSSSLNYQTRIAMNIDANGISELGEDISRQAISLQSFGLRATDSAIFDAQTFAYSAPRKRLVFPVTAGNSWQSTLDFSTNYTLKLPYRPNPYLGRRITYLTQKDTVAGWGRMRIKVNNTTTSAWMDVLAVKTRVELRDSFYIDGAVASSNFLTPFGLKQNMPDSTFKVQFFRKGEVSPLFTVEYNDANFTSVLVSAAHQNRIPANVGLNSVNAAADFKLYPNPSTVASGFDIELVEAGAGSWSYNLLDASGKVIGSAAIQQAGGKAHIDAKTAVPGRYFLSISKDGRQVGAKPVVIGN